MMVTVNSQPPLPHATSTNTKSDVYQQTLVAVYFNNELSRMATHADAQVAVLDRCPKVEIELIIAISTYQPMCIYKE